jgi:hypothetical protein
VQHTLPPNITAGIGIALLMALFLAGCTTVENRRDLYFPQVVEGPYTRMLHKGIPTPTPQKGTIDNKGSSGKEVIKPRG